jgi:uncharacterized tellurite resistance protein B-like protein
MKDTTPIPIKQKRHFLDLYHMALTDMGVDVKELELLYRIGVERGLPPEEIDRVIVRPDEIGIHHPATVPEKAEFLYDLVRMAWADGRMTDEEEHLLTQLCTKFGFATENIPAIIAFFVEQCGQGVSAEEVKRIVEENA